MFSGNEQKEIETLTIEIDPRDLAAWLEGSGGDDDVWDALNAALEKWRELTNREPISAD